MVPCQNFMQKRHNFFLNATRFKRGHISWDVTFESVVGDYRPSRSGHGRDDGRKEWQDTAAEHGCLIRDNGAGWNGN